MPRIDATLKTLKEQFDVMRGIARGESLVVVVPRVSAWSPAEHLDHSIRVTASVLKNVADSNEIAGGINLLGRIILLAGRIPRGRGRSPERFRGALTDRTALEAAITSVEQQLATNDRALLLSPKVISRHPRFAGLTAEQALRFLAIHTDHHLRIVRDILRATPVTAPRS